MPANSYKVTESPVPKKKSDSSKPKESDKSSSSEQTSDKEISSSKPVANGESKSGKGGNVKSTNGILKNANMALAKPELIAKEKWEKNYVPACDHNDNDVTDKKKMSTEKVVQSSPKPKKVSRSATTDENMVRKVSEIFEEVFKEQRGHWNFSVEYFLACLGMPIAFSSLWRFPYLISRFGGGAFLFAYIFMLLIVGMPLFLMESILGQFAQLSCIHIWRCAPLMQGVGVAMIVLSLITSIYNSQIIAYVVHYFFASFVNTDGLMLWAECKSPWSNCYDSTVRSVCAPFNATDIDPADCYRLATSSSKFYWQENVLRWTDLGDIGRTGPIHWDLALCLVFVWISVLVILVRGVKSFGVFAFISGTIPIGILIAFLIATFQMDPKGAMNGLVTFYTPDWDWLIEPELWQKAAEQVIFSLSIMYGSVMTLSSYKKIRNTVEVAPIVLVIANLILSVLASTTVFAMLGSLANAIEVQNPRDLFAAEVSNIELLFTRLPEAIAVILPIPHAWSVFFFLMLLLFGLHSQAALIESICTTVYDAMPKMRKKKFIVVGCLVLPLLLFSIPLSSATGLHIHRLLESAIIGPNILLLVIIELISLQYIYGVRRFSNDCQLIMRKPLSIYWKVCWAFICPVTLVVLLVFAGIDWERMLYEGRKEDLDWTLYLSWVLTLLPLAMIPLTLIFTLFYKLCKKEPLSQPSYLWGPGCPKLREKLAETAEEADVAGTDNEAYNQN